jgi:hypothetical protein
MYKTRPTDPTNTTEPAGDHRQHHPSAEPVLLFEIPVESHVGVVAELVRPGSPPREHAGDHAGLPVLFSLQERSEGLEGLGVVFVDVGILRGSDRNVQL